MPSHPRQIRLYKDVERLVEAAHRAGEGESMTDVVNTILRDEFQRRGTVIAPPKPNDPTMNARVIRPTQRRFG